MKVSIVKVLGRVRVWKSLKKFKYVNVEARLKEQFNCIRCKPLSRIFKLQQNGFNVLYKPSISK